MVGAGNWYEVVHGESQPREAAELTLGYTECEAGEFGVVRVNERVVGIGLGRLQDRELYRK